MRDCQNKISCKFVVGWLIWTSLLATQLEALRGSAVILHAKTKANEQKAENEIAAASTVVNGTISTNSTKSLLTGIPQIDYVLDPNLPRELNGQNLTHYPFYSAVPDDIDFKCDGLHDGFYASVLHKCQVYHHCLFGTRYDFLCANYTAFDQKTFICHFVSEVDCDNSPKYYNRNEALYKEASTAAPSTTTAPPTTTTISYSNSNSNFNGNNNGNRHGGNNPSRRRRPYRRRRPPIYDYYYEDDEEEYDFEYYDDEESEPDHRPSHKKQFNQQNSRSSDEYDNARNDHVKPTQRTNSATGSVYEKPRVPPKIRRPVPKSERNKYDYSVHSMASSTQEAVATTSAPSHSSDKRKKKPVVDDEYYDDEEEYDEDAESKGTSQQRKVQSDYESGHVGGAGDGRRYRNHGGRYPAVTRKRIPYDDYDDERPLYRSNRRKVSFRPYRTKGRVQDDAPKHRKRVGEAEFRGRRYPEPKYYDDEYYDDEEADLEHDRRREDRKNAKPRNKQPKGVKNDGNQRVRSHQDSDSDEEEREVRDRGKQRKNLPDDDGRKYAKTESPPARANDSKQGNTNNYNYNKEQTKYTLGVETTTTKKPAMKVTSEANHQAATLQLRPLAATPKSSTDSEDKTPAPYRHFVAMSQGGKKQPGQASHQTALVDAKTGPKDKFFQNASPVKLSDPVSKLIPNNVGYYSSKPSGSHVKLPDYTTASPSSIPIHNRTHYDPPMLDYDKNRLRGEAPKLTPKEPSDNIIDYRQSLPHRLFTSSDGLYNSVSFPSNPPANYDITAPGPSAPGGIHRKYPNPYAVDPYEYDIAANEALQPASTLVPRQHFQFPNQGYQVRGSGSGSDRPQRRLIQSTAFGVQQ